MQKYAPAISFLLVILAVYWSFEALLPTYTDRGEVSEKAFSTDRALAHVEQISKKPHGVGFPAHAEVRNYIMAQLNELGLETSLQEGYTAGDWGNLSKATNILARIEGSGKGKALLLLTHYDSSPHSSLGASDAGSGVATILEGVRAFLAGSASPENDIIILITDAEELGLNGAQLFVNDHPWAKDVGLALNFEARGSGGPGYMLVETNGGNDRLIREFIKADPQYPVGNSLAYSIYKMLPNDTDLTVFREEGDIDGFNFAFIDDHFDYHTVRDNYARLDRNTLAHQGSYLMPLLHHFARTDLTALKSSEDLVYFNVPFFRMVSYPFAWIWILYDLALIATIALIIYGFRKKVLRWRDALKGFLPLLLSLGINGVVGYFGWKVLTTLYPAYRDILQGFPYNGHAYIAFFTLFALAICFWCYHLFRKVTPPNLMLAPLMLWLAVCWGLSTYLPGAAFFIIPVLGFLASYWVVIRQQGPNRYILVLLAIPTLWIFAPLIKMFPVGLGLKMIVASTVLTTLTFFLLVPLIGFYRRKDQLAWLSLILCLGFFVAAHFAASFDRDHAKPTSLVYVLDADKKTAQWATYERVVSDWTAQFVKADEQSPEQEGQKTLSSKYGSGFTFVTSAPVNDLPQPIVEMTKDTLIGSQRWIDLRISHQRPVQRLEIFSELDSITSAMANGIPLAPQFLKDRKGGRLLTHYISGNAPTELRLAFPKNHPLELTLYEASNDLLEHPHFSVPPRPEENIPMPFVLNDAIIIVKTIRYHP